MRYEENPDNLMLLMMENLPREIQEHLISNEKRLIQENSNTGVVLPKAMTKSFSLNSLSNDLAPIFEENNEDGLDFE